MKKNAYLFLFTFILTSCTQNDDTPGDPEFKDEPNTIESYQNDAYQLYFQEILDDTSHPNYNDPILDENEVTEIYEIIEAVYNSDSPQRDTVFDIHRIHTLTCHNLWSMLMEVETERPEIQNLANNMIPTGESSLDNILSTYAFDTVRVSHGYPGTPWLSVRSDNALNMIPIEKEFNDLESVVLAECEKGCEGRDGSHITLSRDDNSATITFSLGVGDCPAGCFYHIHWEFEVTNGVVEFIRTYEH